MHQAEVFRMNPERVRQQQRLFLLLPVMTFVPMLGLLLLGGSDQATIVSGILQKPIFVLLLLAMFGLSVLMSKLFCVLERSARLYVDAQGLRFESGVTGGIHRWTRMDWSLRWDEIRQTRHVALIDAMQFVPAGMFATPRALRFADWINAGAPDDPGRTLRSVLQAHGGGSPASAGGEDPLSFDLMKHPATRKILLLSGALIAYALPDLYFNDETYLADSFRYIWPPLVMAALASAAAAVLLFRTGTSRRVPAFIAIVLMFSTLAPATGFATYAGLVRLGQAFGGAMLERPYHRQAGGSRLLPQDPQLPALILSAAYRGYWCQYPITQEIMLPVRKGLLGYYHIDQSVFRDDMDIYLRERRKQRAAADVGRKMEDNCPSIGTPHIIAKRKR